MKDKIILLDKRWCESEHQKEMVQTRKAQGLPAHVGPGSTLIAAMGNHWREGCLDAVHEMANKAFQAGYPVCLWEVPDRCYQPYDALGVMRNSAYMRALEEGWEYLLYLDNDVLPPSDLLVKLLERHVPIVSPIVLYSDGQDHGLGMPKMNRNHGLALVSSCVLSCLLFRTSVFFPWALIPFWQDALGADENYHFQRLAMAGHLPFVDTDVMVTAYSPPHYPLDSVVRNCQSLDETFGG